MNVVDYILTKRNGGVLDTEDVHALIEAYTLGEVP